MRGRPELFTRAILSSKRVFIDRYTSGTIGLLMALLPKLEPAKARRLA